MGKPDKDRRSREKGKICNEAMGQLTYMIFGDSSYQTTRSYDGKTKKIREAMRKLNDPHFILERLNSLMGPIAMENTSSSVNVKSAFQVLESVLEQSKNTVLYQDPANEVGENNPELLPLKGQETKAESHFQGDTVLNQGCPNEIYEHLRFTRQETNGESHFRGGLKQAIPMVTSTSEVPNADPLEMAKYEGVSLDLEILKNLSNEENLEDLYHVGNIMIKDWADWSEVTRVKDYTVFKPNAKVLTEIFDKHPDVDDTFQLKHPSFQRFFMMSLAEAYQKIRSKAEMDIPEMKLLVQDMEFTGLKLPWVKKMLEDKAEMKRLREEITSDEAELNKKKEKLDELEKGKETIV